MSAGFKFAGVVSWGTNGAVEALLEALVAQAERQLGTVDPLTTFLRDERDGFYTGKVVVIDEPLATPAARQRFLSLMNDASQGLLREGSLTEHGRVWLSTEIARLRDHIREQDETTGRVAIGRWRVALFLVIVTLCFGYWISRWPPFRTPNYVVQVQSVEPSKFRPGMQCLVLDQRRQLDCRLYVVIPTDTPVWDSAGGSGTVAAGQTISVWTDGVEAVTVPPVAYATFVQIHTPGARP